MNKRKICVVTGTRAEYGLLYWLMKEIKNDKELKLQIIATGMHLSPEFGLTYKEIEEDGFKIDKKVEILLSSDTEVGITKSVGLGCISFAEALDKLTPDMIVVLGDRFEILSAAIAAMINKIPIVHIHGGESTEGVIDEQIRHSVTKMANLHFPVTEEYKERIIQMGENPELVFNYGAPGLDNLYRLSLLEKDKLEHKLGFKFEDKVAIATYHPTTLANSVLKKNIIDFLEAIKEFDFKVIFTKANSDAGGKYINKKISSFVKENPNKYKLFDNLGQLKYLSTLKYVDLMIGNSSSGIIEAPSFNIPVVNVGDRQKGRVKAENIIDCGHKKNQIVEGIKKALAKTGNLGSNYKNPYDNFSDGKISYRIKEKIKEVNIDNKLIKKSFNDINISGV